MSSRINGVLIDSCVLLDLFTNDPNWADWSEHILGQYSASNTLYINAMIYTEIAIVFKTIEEVDCALAQIPVKVLEMPRVLIFSG